MEGMGYLAAAYAVVLITLAGYAIALVRRDRALRRELASSTGPRGRGAG